MDENPADKIEPAGDEKLRLAEPDPLPAVRTSEARASSAEAAGPEVEKPRRRSSRPKERHRRMDDDGRSSQWGRIAFAFVVVLVVGAGLWRWRMTPAKAKTVVIESPLEYHKRQFLVALRGDGSNAVPMQLRADRMRFHQRALISQGFLAERNFVFTNGAAGARVAVNRIEGVSMEYAIVEPRGKDVLAVIAPKDDMSAWESLMRLSGAK